jgi:hypothetical protein
LSLILVNADSRVSLVVTPEHTKFGPS